MFVFVPTFFAFLILVVFWKKPLFSTILIALVLVIQTGMLIIGFSIPNQGLQEGGLPMIGLFSLPILATLIVSILKLKNRRK